MDWFFNWDEGYIAECVIALLGLITTILGYFTWRIKKKMNTNKLVTAIIELAKKSEDPKKFLKDLKFTDEEIKELEGKYGPIS